MLNDEQFNSLSWVTLDSIQELAGAEIEDTEPIMDGANMCGIVLYIKRKNGHRAAVSICTPDILDDDMYIDIREGDIRL